MRYPPEAKPHNSTNHRKARRRGLRIWCLKFIGACVFLLALSPLNVAQGQGCESTAEAAADTWHKYKDEARKVGCALGAAGTAVASSGVALPAALAQYHGCVQETKHAQKLTERMVEFYNDKIAGQGWGRLGPRHFDLSGAEEGTIPSKGQRMYITSPLQSNRTKLKIKKLGGKGKTNVTVCKWRPDGSGGKVQSEKVWNVDIGPGTGTTGNVWTYEISNVKGRILTVLFTGKSVTRHMKYRLSEGVMLVDEVEKKMKDFTIEYGYNRDGSDYRNFDLKSPEPSLCQRACAKDDRCKAFTYVEPGMQGKSARCWLKDGVPARSKKEGLISGVKGGVDQKRGDEAAPMSAEEAAQAVGDAVSSQIKEEEVPLSAESKEWVGTYEGRNDGRNARITIQPTSNNTALSVKFEDLDRETTLSATVSGEQVSKRPVHILEDLELTGSGGSVKNIDRLLLHNDSDYVTGYSLWKGTNYGMAFSTGGVASPVSSGGKFDESNVLDEWTGLYKGYLDGRRARLAVDRRGSQLDVTLEDLDRSTTFTGAVQPSNGQSSPAHVLRNLHLKSADGGTKKIEKLVLHTWDTNYISGNSEWKGTDYGNFFIRVGK